MKNQLPFLVSAGILFTLSASSCSETTRKASNDSSAVQPAREHNSRSSLDWQGSYHGMLPCADCAGIETIIILNEDNSYRISRKYLNKDTTQFTTSGSFTWTNDGNKIILDTANNNRMLQVGENQLFWMDDEGNRITGPLATQYRLVKQSNGMPQKQ